jgi:Trk K+ transport system NAD-binding subunit/Kef-type K+ transport system membrane component KefB
MEILVSFAGFIFVVLASKQIGEYLTHFHLPLISGYLLAGVVAGPFILNFIDVDIVRDLRFIDELSLAFIAFAAGSEMHLEELRSRLKSIAWHTIGLVLSVYLVGSVTVFFLANWLPFAKDMDTAGKVAVAILAGSILVARSPSSAIAIVNELRAKGPFTKTILGVTIVMDMVVVTLFAINTSIADVLLTADKFEIGFILLLVLELLASILLGYLVGRVLEVITCAHLDQRLKITLILLTGYGVFFFATEFRHFTHEQLPFDILLESLLICMVGSFWMTNYGKLRHGFLEMLEEVGPFIYVMFFTLVGDALELDVLGQMWPIALALFGMRLVGIFIGSFGGGVIAGDPMKYNRVAWMSYITQAGVGLGLAQQAADEFPQLGEEFATLMISVIALTQIVGPPFFKIAIKNVGEAHLPGTAHPDEIRDVLIMGINSQSLALAQQLEAQDWKVIVADTDSSQFEWFESTDIEVRLIPEISANVMCDLITSATDAMVMMLPNDAANLQACELACEEFGIPRMVVNLKDHAWADKFTALGAKVVYPASAIVNLLDRYVTTPQSADLLMNTNENNEIVQITINDPDIDGLELYEVRLPPDVLVLGLSRDGAAIIPHGHTILKLGDDVTIVGSRKSLKEITLLLGY